MFDEENELNDMYFSLIAEYVTVHNTARYFPNLYFSWYEKLSPEERIFISKIKEKEIMLAANAAVMEQESIIREERLIAEALRILKEADDKNNHDE